MVTVCERGREGSEGAREHRSAADAIIRWALTPLRPETLHPAAPDTQPMRPTADKLSPPPPAQKTLSHTVYYRDLVILQQILLILCLILLLIFQEVDSKMNPIDWDYSVSLMYPY